MASSGLYIGGEETAVIATVEGGFPFPRRKPPFPAEQGVRGARRSSTTPRRSPTCPAYPAPRRRLVSRARSRRGIRHQALSRSRATCCGPACTSCRWERRSRRWSSSTAAACCRASELQGGVHRRPVEHPADQARSRRAARFRLRAAAASRLGTGAMIVVSEGTSIVRKVAEYVDFFAKGSCGQCPPCKGGTFQLSRLLNASTRAAACGGTSRRCAICAASCPAAAAAAS